MISSEVSSHWDRLRLRRITKLINDEYGKSGYEPVVLIERTVPLYERVALYNLARAIILTATRDGMNLVPYEYIVCREGPPSVSHLSLLSSVLLVCFDRWVQLYFCLECRACCIRSNHAGFSQPAQQCSCCERVRRMLAVTQWCHPSKSLERIRCC